MLTRILNLFAENPKPLCVEEVAHSLHADASAVEGMLTALTRMGRLVEVEAENSCEDCPLRSLCLPKPHRQRTFQLADANAEPAESP